MMLIFTNRQLASGTTESAFGRNFTPGGTQLAVASVAAGGKGWKLSDLDEEVSEEDALSLLLPLFRGNNPLVLYVHGNNNTPADCFERVTAL
jgi:hypothetical protein